MTCEQCISKYLLPHLAPAASDFAPILQQHTTTPRRDTDADVAVMLDNLRSHRHQALVLDAPVIAQLAALSPECDMFAVGEPFETFNLAIAFPPTAPDSLAANVSAAIIRLQVRFLVQPGCCCQLSQAFNMHCPGHGLGWASLPAHPAADHPSTP